METGIVSEIPQPARRSKYGIDWDLFANLARQSGQPVLAGKNIVDSQVKSLRQRRREPFISMEGCIEVRLRNSQISPEDGRRYGDVYFEWVPYTDEFNREFDALYG